MHRIKTLPVIIALFILTTSCNGILNISTGVPDECIGTFEDFAYSYEEVEDYSRPEDILPYSPWEVELEYPNDGASYLLANIREINGETEIWNNRYEKSKIDPLKNIYSFMIYHPDTKEQTIISAEIEDTDVYISGNVFFANDGSVWGVNWWDPTIDYSLYSHVPILSKFNPETQRFEFDKHTLIQIDHEYRQRLNVFLDKDGIFWFFVPFDGIYSYNPNTRELSKRHANPGNWVDTLILAPDGNFYYTLLENYDIVAPYHHWEREKEVYQFSPLSGEETIYTVIPKAWPKSGRMLMDHTGRMLFGTFGWLEPDGTWHLMHPDLNLYYEAVTRPYGFLWESPYVVKETSNGYIWFSKHNENYYGFAWYDPETGGSCWFTNVPGSLIEGPDQTMWFSYGDKLYKYALNS